ncbi:beta-hexosaminidase 1 [Wolffia australiana]
MLAELWNLFLLFFLIQGFCPDLIACRTVPASELSLKLDESLPLLWPQPMEFRHGNETLSVDPKLEFRVVGAGSNSSILAEALERYRGIVFRHRTKSSPRPTFDLGRLTIVVSSDSEELQLGVDESYTLFVAGRNPLSIVAEATIEANTIYGAIRGLETFSQLCSFNFKTKEVQVHKAPWYINDKPRFTFRGLLIDTSRHYLPVNVIKQVIDSMSYAKLNVLHWHIIDEQAFPLEVPSYPDLWNGSYTKWERYTIEDAYDLVEYAKRRGVNIMPEIDVPGHAESWGIGYPDLWPSPICREPLDVSQEFTFSVISGILQDMHNIFPFELFHLGGDEVNTECWSSTIHVKQWLENKNMTEKDGYQYFVLRAQQIAAAQNRTPVNWEETFNIFGDKLHPQTVVHNWWGPGVCPKVVAKGLRCIMSNQGQWYLDHLDVPWEDFYISEPLEGIVDPSQQELVIGGEVCMWGETADTSDIQQTIWPRAAAAAERLWSPRAATTGGDLNAIVLPRLEYFRCLLNRRGVAAAPVTNSLARKPPIGPGSCFVQ